MGLGLGLGCLGLRVRVWVGVRVEVGVRVGVRGWGRGSGVRVTSTDTVSSAPYSRTSRQSGCESSPAARGGYIHGGYMAVTAARAGRAAESPAVRRG